MSTDWGLKVFSVVIMNGYRVYLFRIVSGLLLILMVQKELSMRIRLTAGSRMLQQKQVRTLIWYLLASVEVKRRTIRIITIKRRGGRLSCSAPLTARARTAVLRMRMRVTLHRTRSRLSRGVSLSGALYAKRRALERSKHCQCFDP